MYLEYVIVLLSEECFWFFFEYWYDKKINNFIFILDLFDLYK